MECEVRLEQRGTLSKVMPLVYALFVVAAIPWLYLVLILREPFVGTMMSLVMALFAGALVLLKRTAGDSPLWQFTPDALIVTARVGSTTIPWDEIGDVHLRSHGLPVTFPAWLEIRGRALRPSMPLRVAPQEVASLESLDVLLANLIEHAPPDVVDPEVALVAAFVRRTLDAGRDEPSSAIVEAARALDCKRVVDTSAGARSLSSSEEVLRATCLFLLGDIHEAAKACDEALSQEPGLWEARLCRALCHEKSGDLVSAREMLEAALATEGVRFRRLLEVDRDRLRSDGRVEEH